MPTHLSNDIRRMYDGDEYVLIDGTKMSSPYNSTALLKVKNKVILYLLPLLFSLFIDDVDNEYGNGFVGAATGTEGIRVPGSSHSLQ